MPKVRQSLRLLPHEIELLRTLYNTKDRGEWLNDLSLGEITSAIQSKRPKKRRTNG